MKKKAKMKRISIMCVLAAVLLCTCIPAAAESRTSGSGEYGFNLPGGGAKSSSYEVTKVSTNSYARVWVEEIDNMDSTPLYFRVRLNNASSASGQGTAVTDAKTIYDRITYYDLSYLSGYGTVGKEYKLWGQADSSSIYGAEVGGTWMP